MQFSPIMLFLGQALVIIALPYLSWRLRPLRHAVPLVVVQILVGIALGPTVAGQIAPEIWRAVFSPASLQNITGLAWLSVVFFAFLTGLHFDLAEMRGRGRAFAVTSLSSIVVPSLAGAAAGWGLLAAYPQAAGPSATAVTFSLGMGIAAGVTALPVLGAILREMHLTRDPMGTLALGCAAVNDAALWVLVAGLLAMSSGSGPGAALGVMLAAGLYCAVMLILVRPALARLFRHAVLHKRINERDVVLLSALVLASAMITEVIGIHYIIGAFVFGAIMPKEVAKDVLVKFESFVTVILLPFFFIATGLKTDFAIGSPLVLVVFAAMSAVAVAGKIAGTAIPHRLGGASWRDAMTLGALVMCKGLMEILVLTMLLEAGIISSECFSAMILMAVATTAATKPLVLLLRRSGVKG